MQNKIRNEIATGYYELCSQNKTKIPKLISLVKTNHQIKEMSKMEFNFSLVPYLQKRNFPFVGLTYAPAEGINVGRDPKAKSTERQLQLSM